MTDDRAKPTVCVVLPSGAGLPFCSIEHLGAWSGELGQRFDVAIGQTSASLNYCSHCHWCGRRIRRPAGCVLHDGDCPGRLWLVTVRASKVIAAFVRLLGRQPTDDDIAVLAEVADRRLHLDADEVVRAVFEPDIEL